MRSFNPIVALIAFILYILLIGLESWPVGVVFAGFAGFAFALLFREKRVIAFDAGGVMTEGDYFTERLRERSGMRGIVNRLRKRYKVVLFTNQNAIAHKAIGKELGFAGLFDEQIVSGEIGVKKPDKGIFNYLFKRFNIRPSQLVFIDDTAENVDSAKRIGVIGIQFTSPERLMTDLRRLNIDI